MKYSQNTSSFEESYKAFRNKSEPVNPDLWDAVQDLAWGNSKTLQLEDRKITAPNEGEGYRYSPSYAKAWAIEKYKELGGKWKKQERKSLAEDEVFQEAVRKNTVGEENVEYDKEAMQELVGDDPFLHSLLEALKSEFDDGYKALFEGYVREDDQVREVYKQFLD